MKYKLALLISILLPAPALAVDWLEAADTNTARWATSFDAAMRACITWANEGSRAALNESWPFVHKRERFYEDGSADYLSYRYNNPDAYLSVWLEGYDDPHDTRCGVSESDAASTSYDANEPYRSPSPAEDAALRNRAYLSPEEVHPILVAWATQRAPQLGFEVRPITEKMTGISKKMEDYAAALRFCDGPVFASVELLKNPDTGGEPSWFVSYRSQARDDGAYICDDE